jgi:hypothetical protein
VVTIAKSWAQEDLRIFLMDLGLDAPSLHIAVGLLNREGVSDAFLYGASVQRIAKPALDDDIFFAPAGTATTEPEQILGHPRWDDLAGGFSEADATLLLFLPTNLPGAEKIISRATDVIFLAGEGESSELHLGPAIVKTVAVVGPSGSPPGGFDQPMGPGLGGFGDAASTPDTPVSIADELILTGAKPGIDSGLELSPDLSISEGFAREVAEGEGSDETMPEDASPGAFEMGGVVYSEEVILESAEGGTEEGNGAVDLGEDMVLERGGDFGDQEVPAQEVPDFGAEFVDMPSLEDEIVEGQGVEDAAPDRGSEAGVESSPERPPDREEAEPAEGAKARTRPEPRRGYPPAPDGPRPKLRPPPKKIFTFPRVAVGTVALAVLLAALGTAFGTFSVPGFRWLEGRLRELPSPPLEIGGTQPVDPVLRYSLELRVFDAEQRDVAVVLRNELRRARADLVFTLTPRQVGEEVRFFLHAGPAVDAIEAENLRGPLSEILTNEIAEDWPLRPTRFAFLLDEVSTLEEARESLAAAEVGGAMGYILRVTYPDGDEAYRVLSGAFAEVDHARWWQLELRNLGYRDVPLVHRRGSPPE